MDAVTNLQTIMEFSINHVLASGAYSPIAKAAFHATLLQRSIKTIKYNVASPGPLKTALISGLRYGYMFLEHTEEVKHIKLKLMEKNGASIFFEKPLRVNILC